MDHGCEGDVCVIAARQEAIGEVTAVHHGRHDVSRTLKRLSKEHPGIDLGLDGEIERRSARWEAVQLNRREHLFESDDARVALAALALEALLLVALHDNSINT